MRSGFWVWFGAVPAEGLLGAWYFWRGGTSSLFLLLLFTFVMLQGALFQIIGPKRITAVRTWIPALPAAGGELAVTLTVTCESGVPPLWLQVQDELAFCFGSPSGVRSENKGKLIFTGFKRKFSGTYYLKEIGRGIYADTPVILTWGDAFGWFRRNKRIETADKLIVYPEPLAFSPPIVTGKIDYAADEAIGSDYWRASVAADFSAAGRLRKYETGDPLRRIHWKSSAKHGTLLTRIPDEREEAPCCLLLDTELSAYMPNEKVNEKVNDINKSSSAASQGVRTFELAVSAAASWMQREAAEAGNKDILFCHAGMKDLSAVSLSGRLGVYDGMEQLADVQPGQGKLAEALIENAQNSHFAPGLRLTLITGGLTPELTNHVLRLAESGINPEIWCARVSDGPGTQNAEQLASRLRERGINVVLLPSYGKEQTGKEGNGYVSA